MALTLQQVSEHNSAASCWVIINDKVYDVTEFLPVRTVSLCSPTQYLNRRPIRSILVVLTSS